MFPAAYNSSTGISGKLSRINHIVLSEALSRVRTLTPVPAPTGDASVIAPDNFARFWRLGGGLSFFQGIKCFTTVCENQPRRSTISRAIFAAYRYGIAQAHRVIKINDRSATPLFHPSTRVFVALQPSRVRFGFAPNALNTAFRASICACAHAGWPLITA